MSQPSADPATNVPTQSTSNPSPSLALEQERDSRLQLPPFRWHLFLCADQTKPKCCAKPVGLEAWNYLKQRIKALNLDTGDLQVHRTKANCLRGCDYNIPGPVLLLYPGGYWYRSATPEAIERILQEHILEGTPVEEFLIAQTPLTPTKPLGDRPDPHPELSSDNPVAGN